MSNLPAQILAFGDDSAAIERAVRATLMPPLNSSLKPIRSDDGDQITGFELNTFCLTIDDLEAGIAMLECAFKPASRREVLQELTRLSVVTKSSDKGEVEAKLRLAAFTDELEKLPIDAVRSGCRKWARENTWSPSMFELLAACQQFCAFRVHARQALIDAATARREGRDLRSLKVQMIRDGTRSMNTRQSDFQMLIDAGEITREQAKSVGWIE